MSNANTAAAHAEEHHVLPDGLFILVWVGLLILTGITVAGSVLFPGQVGIAVAINLANVTTRVAVEGTVIGSSVDISAGSTDYFGDAKNYLEMAKSVNPAGYAEKADALLKRIDG